MLGVLLLYTALLRVQGLGTERQPRSSYIVHEHRHALLNEFWSGVRLECQNKYEHMVVRQDKSHTAAPARTNTRKLHVRMRHDHTVFA